jgi:hypothetical protein
VAPRLRGSEWQCAVSAITTGRWSRRDGRLIKKGQASKMSRMNRRTYLMRTNIFGFLLPYLLLAGSCFGSMPGPTQRSAITSGGSSDVKLGQEKGANTTPVSAKGKFDTCALISNSEIQSVQGESVKETKSSARVNGTFVMSHCFYLLPTFHKSVSLEVTQSNPENPTKYGPKDRWKEMFHSIKGKEGENERESSAPLPVSGIGDEAFWMGNQITGALYVLKKNIYLRISIGGPDKVSMKIEKTKTLAQKALKRL